MFTAEDDFAKLIGCLLTALHAETRTTASGHRALELAFLGKPGDLVTV